jgi:hypothetical protein
LGHREVCAGLDLAAVAIELELQVVSRWVDCDADMERRGGVDPSAIEVLAPVEMRHELHEADRVDFVHAPGARVVADLGRVAGH